MIIYHSREALTARLAGLLHIGALERHVNPEQAWRAIKALEAYRAEGLWPLGADEQGHAVYAVGRASRPDVVDRVFHGIAEVFGIVPTTYLLVDVGPDGAWRDLLVVGLRRMGLERLPRAMELHLLASRWEASLTAVQRARFRLTERHGGPA